MNYLKDKSVYLCGSITASKDDGITWRHQVTEGLSKFGLNIMDPTKQTAQGVGEVQDDKAHWKSLVKARKFEQLKEEFWPIIRKDLRSVDKADFLIVYYSPRTVILGTTHEIINAHNQRKPILVFCPEEEMDDFNPWMVTYIKSGCLFTKWEDMYQYLEKVDRKEFNTSYWTL